MKAISHIVRSRVYSTNGLLPYYSVGFASTFTYAIGKRKLKFNSSFFQKYKIVTYNIMHQRKRRRHMKLREVTGSTRNCSHCKRESHTNSELWACGAGHDRRITNHDRPGCGMGVVLADGDPSIMMIRRLPNPDDKASSIQF